MSLSYNQIIEQRELGNIVIEPFNESQVNPNSYNVQIGSSYYIATSDQTVYLGNKKSIRDLWTEAVEARVPTYDEIKQHNIPLNTKVIEFFPYQTLMCYTNEFIGAKRNYSTRMYGRSTMARAGIIVGIGGFGDTGFYNRWGIIMKNTTGNTLLLPVGLCVAQIEFFPVTAIDDTKSNEKTDATERYTTKGNYQTVDDLTELMKNWDVSSLLPKK